MEFFIPSFIVKNRSIYFAVDNVDFLEDTPTGKDTLHGTAIVVYQQHIPGAEAMVSPLKLSTDNRNSSNKESSNIELHACAPPKSLSQKHEMFVSDKYISESQHYALHDTTWIVGCCMGNAMVLDEESPIHAKPNDENVPTALTEQSVEKHIPTWAAYNSLINDKRPLTNVAVPPLLRSSPTSWPGLYTALMRAHKCSSYGPPKVDSYNIRSSAL